MHMGQNTIILQGGTASAGMHGHMRLPDTFYQGMHLGLSGWHEWGLEVRELVYLRVFVWLLVVVVVAVFVVAAAVVAVARGIGFGGLGFGCRCCPCRERSST